MELRDPEEVGATALRRLVFIELPPALARDIGSFRPDPAIPLPVETAGAATDEEGTGGRFDPRTLTGEALVAGMLRLLAWRPSHQHADYYRSFVLAVKPEILAELSQAGIAKARNKDWEIAEEIFRALAGLFPKAPEPLLDLAILSEDRAESYVETGREALAEEMAERAFEAYKRLLALEPPFPPAFFNAGFFFLRRRNFERASSLFETYIQIGDDEEKKARAREIRDRLGQQGYLDNLFKEAYDFIRLGEEEKGLEKAREFIARHPEVWNGWFLVGWACRRLSRWEEGREAFEKAVALGAEGVDSLNELSICLLELGRVPEARKALEKALRAEPENVKVITNLGAVALRQGRRSEAAGFFRTALELEPEDPSAKVWLERLETESQD
ncbi:MAG TPA: tetratricopeptide repeat protein [Rectinemataceae bacterium]|nr:tetratricopeptide repeat protein [Rectinemataceae bacterium]